MGQLVTDSEFLMASPYSFRVHCTGPKGSLPFFEENPWTGNRPRLEHGPGIENVYRIDILFNAL